MCFWQQEYNRDFRSLSKYGADGNLYLRIRRTKILEFLLYSFKSSSTFPFNYSV